MRDEYSNLLDAAGWLLIILAGAAILLLLFAGCR
jgi:hypothetical protein